jgi:hypothetical protein
MFNSIKIRENRKYYTLAIVPVVLLALLTPFYSIGYLLIIAFSAFRVRPIKSLDSYFSNFVLIFILLCSSIMISGVFTSYFNLPNFPIINASLAALFLLCTSKLEQKDKQKSLQIFNTSDLISIVIALIIPVASLLIFVSASGFQGAMFRIANANGWDSAQHFSFLQVDTANNNYIYSGSPLNKTIHNDYPQGWHMANSDIIEGILPGVFIGNYGFNAEITSYAIIILFWSILAVYILSRTILNILPKTKASRLRITLLTIGVLFVSILSVWTPWYYGFMNYIGMIPFVLIAVYISYYKLLNTDYDLRLYVILSTFLMAAVALIWVLPVLFLGAIFVATLLYTHTGIKSLFRPSLVGYLFVSLVLVSLISIVLYGILIISNVGLGAITQDTSWYRDFPNTILVLIMCLAILYTANRLKQNILPLAHIVMPVFLVCSALWMFVYLKTGVIGYYQAKMFGILFLILSVFFLTNAILWTEVIYDKYRKQVSLFSLILLVTSLLGSLIILSGQNMNLSILQRGYRLLNTNQLVYLDSFISQADKNYDKNSQFIILEDNPQWTNNASAIFNRRSVAISSQYVTLSKPDKNPNTCLPYIWYGFDKEFTLLKETSVIYNNLSKCLKLRSDNELKSTVLVPESRKPNIKSINVYNAEIIYY